MWVEYCIAAQAETDWNSIIWKDICYFPPLLCFIPWVLAQFPLQSRSIAFVTSKIPLNGKFVLGEPTPACTLQGGTRPQINCTSVSAMNLGSQFPSHLNYGLDTRMAGTLYLVCYDVSLSFHNINLKPIKP